MVQAVSPELNALPRKSEWENAEEIHDGLRRAILKNELVVLGLLGVLAPDHDPTTVRTAMKMVALSTAERAF
jgi:hypothetical protein